MSRFLFLLMCFSLSVFAQDYKFRLEGSFSTKASPDPSRPTVVNYSINWNEDGTTLQGVYEDNYFSGSVPRPITGTVGSVGRNISVTLPAPVQGVRQISLSTVQTGTMSGSVPLAITTKNNVSAMVDNLTAYGLLSSTATSENDPQGDCVSGFGALTGFCGLYAGTVSEIRDNRNRCNLLVGGNVRLELALNSVFGIYLNYIPGAANQSIHTIGAFAPSPTSTSVNIIGRYCAALPGTSFVIENCKTMTLNGLFSNQITGPAFTGTYSITDDINADSCTYTMSLNRETAY